MRYLLPFLILMIVLNPVFAQEKKKKNKKETPPPVKVVKQDSGFTTAPSGLKYKVLKSGTGLMAMEGDKVKVHYIEMIHSNDSVIDDTWLKKTPWDLKISPGTAVPGFLEALKLMRPGDKLEVIIPAHLGYGSQQAGCIPPNTDLRFIIEMLEAIQGVRPYMTIGKDTVKSVSGLRYIVVEEGKGLSPAKGDIVTIRYTGYLPDGKIFDSSVERGETIKFNVGQSLPGLDEGLTYMKQGGRTRLLLPYMLAFGENGRGPIPPKTDIIYDIELVDVKQKIAAVPFQVKGKDTVKTASGLKYIVAVKGNGPQAGQGKKVRVHYTGYFQDGSIFDSSVERDMVFELTLGVNPVIPGWTEALALMKAGDKWRLVIPPHLGYGANGFPPKIPGNTTLIFDIEMVEVVQ